MKDVIFVLEVFAIIFALFLLGSESESLAWFLGTKVVGVALLISCAYDMDMLNIKKKGK